MKAKVLLALTLLGLGVCWTITDCGGRHSLSTSAANNQLDFSNQCDGGRFPVSC